MQAESGHLCYLGKTIILFPGRYGLQREHFPTLLRADGYAVADRATQNLPHRVFVDIFERQVAVFFIAFQDSLSLQICRNPVADRVHQFQQFLLVGCVGPVKSAFAPGRGGVNAMYDLGLRYALGQGVAKDLTHAYMWWDIAASQGNEDAKRKRNIIEEQMTSAEVSKAQELARECVAKDYKDC